MSLPPNHSQLTRRTSLDTEGDVQRVLGKLENTGQDLTILRLLANADHLFRPYILLSSQLLHGGVLPGSTRECVILCLAERTRTSYEWAEHEPFAREAGVPQAAIDAIRTGCPIEKVPDVDDATKLAMEIAADLLAGRGTPGERFQQAREHWGAGGAIELLMVVAYWGGMVRLIIDGLGLDASDRNPVDAPPE